MSNPDEPMSSNQNPPDKDMAKRKRSPNPLFYALTAMLIAVTTVFTLLVRIPIPATQGYINFSDVATFFSGFTFGPLVGGLAGGVGAGIADLIGGYAQFAPLTLLAHGLQGALAGLIGHSGSYWATTLANLSQRINQKSGRFAQVFGKMIDFLARHSIWLALFLGWLAGAIAMVSIYMLGEGLVLTNWPSALGEVPANVFQNLAGGLVGIPLFFAVRRAYPAILQFNARKPRDRGVN